MSAAWADPSNDSRKPIQRQQIAIVRERSALKTHDFSAEFRDGLKATAPLLLGVASFAIAYGLLARKAGLSLFNLTFMSLSVFAGAAQFLVVSMLISGAPIYLILFTAFVVNSRYLLMGASLEPHLRRWSAKWKILLSFLLSDESYALTIAHFEKNGPSKHYQLGVSLGLYLEWLMFTIIGGIAGSLLGDPLTLGLDFALPATFIVLLLPLITTWRCIVVCVTTGILSVLGFMFLPSKLYIPFAAVSGLIAGRVLEQSKSR